MKIIRQKKEGFLRGTGGYSLVELMVAIPVTIIVAAGIYAVFNHAHKSSISQKMQNDLQTSCSFAMDYIKNDLSFVGYRAKENPASPITTATGNTITFEYWDDRAVSGPGTKFVANYTNDTLVTYSLDPFPGPGNLKREFLRYFTTLDKYDDTRPTTQVLAENIQDVTFSYFTGDNTSWPIGLGDEADIRTIAVSLTCADALNREDPFTKKIPEMTLTAEVRARNVNVSATPSDTSPPNPPGDPVSWDEGVCGELHVRWPANTDADLAGYTILYSINESGVYSGASKVPAGPKEAGQFETATLTGLEATKFTDATPAIYYIALTAYDQSGNQSVTTSTEVSGNPDPNSRTVIQGVADPDSTIHPIIPAAPTSLTITTPNEFELQLTWPPSPVPGLRGYRLYRSTVSDFIPSDDPDPLIGNLIASETTGLDASATSYTDDNGGAGLIGCVPYYYKLITIACDNTIPIAFLVADADGKNESGENIFVEASEMPTDFDKPGTPVLAARSGYERVMLNFVNPTVDEEPDFSHTKVWFSPGTPPALNAANLIPDNMKADGSYDSDPLKAGIFAKRGTTVVNFNDVEDGDPAYTTPNLKPCYNSEDDPPYTIPVFPATCDPITYHFIAVRYDQCGNASPLLASAQTDAEQCGDCDPAEGLDCAGAPPAPTVTTAGCSGDITLDWDDLSLDPDTGYPDLAGYHIFRCTGLSCDDSGAVEVELTTQGPLWFTDFVDPDVVPGETYSYRVQVTDCFYELNGGDANQDNTIIPDPASSDPLLAVGRIEQDSATAQLVTGYLFPPSLPPPFPFTFAAGLSAVPPTFRHDTVTLWANNTADSLLTLNQLTASWLDSNSLLRIFAFGSSSNPDTPDTIAWSSTPPSPGASTPATLTPLEAGSVVAPLEDTFPFVTRFGKVTGEADMREEVIDYTLVYRNESTKTDGCGGTGQGTFYVPLGPYGYGTTQSQPVAGTLAWPFPGETGLNVLNNVVVPGGGMVDVFTNVFDSSLAGMEAVTLYYYVDDAKVYGIPPLGIPPLSGAYPDFTGSGYEKIPMVKIGGNQWRTPVDGGIPASDDSWVWYFIVAVDNEGNFDRIPEITAGAFQYFQQIEDPCDTVPNAPQNLTGVADLSSATLTWTAPTTNAFPAGWDYNDPEGFEVWRQRDGAGWTRQALVSDTGPGDYNYTDSPADIGIAFYEYYVTTYDSCDPGFGGPRISVGSNVFAEFVEDFCATKPNPPILWGVTSDTPDEVVLSWTPPTTNTSGTEFTDGAGFEIWRQRDGAGFSKIGQVDDVTYTYTDNLAAPGPDDVETADYEYYVTAFDICADPDPIVSDQSNIYVDQSYTGNACDTVPNAPPVLTGVSDAVDGVTISWIPSATNSAPPGTPYSDAGGYEVWRWNNVTTLWTSIATISDLSVMEYDDSPPDIESVQYNYRVFSVDKCPQLSLDWSPIYIETVLDPCASDPTDPPENLSGNLDPAGSYVNLTWTADTYEDVGGYQIWRSRSPDPAIHVKTISDPAVTAWQDTGVAADLHTAVYAYQIRSFDTCAAPNYSDFSDPPWEEDFADDPCDPLPTEPIFQSTPTLDASPAVTCNSENSVTLVWPDAVPDIPDTGAVVWYEVWRCKKAGSTAECASLDTSSTDTWDKIAEGSGIGYTDNLEVGDVFKKNSNPKHKYSYQVKAVNQTCTDAAQQDPQPSTLSIVYAPCP